jgi:hypothetical protein
MTYTINGKEWAEFDINKRCAELMQITVLDKGSYLLLECGFSDYNPCNNLADTDFIIDKCWDELMKLTETFDDGIADGLCTRWEATIINYNCTKLVAACICYIEINEAAL